MIKIIPVAIARHQPNMLFNYSLYLAFTSFFALKDSSIYASQTQTANAIDITFV